MASFWAEAAPPLPGFEPHSLSIPAPASTRLSGHEASCDCLAVEWVEDYRLEQGLVPLITNYRVVRLRLSKKD
jgi:hypothetical protein